MRVIRTMPDDGWVPVANKAARDYGLTWRARGLLAELLSLPDGWDTNVDKLVKQGRAYGNVTEGRAAMRKAMSELADAGYVTYERKQDAHGHWQTEMIVCDEPDPNAVHRRTRNRNVGAPERRATGTSVDRTSEDWSVTRNTDTETYTKTDLQEGEEHSTSLASLAAAADAASESQSPDEQLNAIYGLIDAMTPELRRNALLDLERRRPKIYRQCRNHALAQIKKDSPAVLRDNAAAVVIDRLSYKYAAVHYQPDWPAWLTRPLRARGRA